MRLIARGTAGHGSLPRSDNPVVHLARAITRLADAEQPVALNTTTRRYFAELARLPAHAWIAPLLTQLENAATGTPISRQVRQRDPELGAMLQTTVSPTMLEGGVKINVIPNTAEAQLDVRGLPTETEQDVYTRFRGIIDDPAVSSSRPVDSGCPLPSQVR
jgi:acetylornithine deacetylase/succinyl-diaminopimelate desuccinylase-like protein